MQAIMKSWHQQGFGAFQILPYMKKKSIFTVSNIILASNGNMKVMKPMLYFAETNLSIFGQVTTRFTALYQPYSAKNNCQENMIWYA